MHIVLIGGGSGVANLIKTFQKDPDVQLTAIISTSDSGGSTGVLRQMYAVPALGDIRKNLSSLAGKASIWTEYRFEHGFLDGHPVGNIWLLGLIEQYWVGEGLARAHEMLGIHTHRILPATEEIHDILVTLKNGERMLWEDHIISQTHLSNQIAALELTPRTHAYWPAQQAILDADCILLGPGTFYTSLIACLLPEGMLDTLRRSKAKKIFIANASNFPPGHCDGYDVDTYLSEMDRFLGAINIDKILVHDGTWVDENQRVAVGKNSPQKIVDNFLSDIPSTKKSKFCSIPRNTLRHNAEKVLQTIKSIILLSVPSSKY